MLWVKLLSSAIFVSGSWHRHLFASYILDRRASRYSTVLYMRVHSLVHLLLDPARSFLYLLHNAFLSIFIFILLYMNDWYMVHIVHLFVTGGPIVIGHLVQATCTGVGHIASCIFCTSGSINLQLDAVTIPAVAWREYMGRRFCTFLPLNFWYIFLSDFVHRRCLFGVHGMVSLSSACRSYLLPSSFPSHQVQALWYRRRRQSSMRVASFCHS